MHYVYVLKSEQHQRFYVGMTENVETRLKQHNSGKTKSTMPWKPWILFFAEEFETRVEARAREKYLKIGYGKQWIKEKWAKQDS